MTRIIAALGALALAVPAFVQSPAYAATVEIEAEGPVIELNMYESIEAEPDLVTIGAGVSTQAPTAVEALRRNSTEMTRVIDRIKSLGVAEKDIQTTGINLNADYDYNRQTRKNEFKGYRVSNRVSVKLRDMDETGRVLDALVVAGATDLSGPSFSIEDDSEPKAKARMRAIERAKERAMGYAAMLGYDGYKVLEINESIRGNASMGRSMMARVAVEEVAADAPVQPGMVSTGVSMTIKFELTDSTAEEEAAQE